VVATQSFNVTSGFWAFGRLPLRCRLGASLNADGVAPAWSLGWTSRSSLPVVWETLSQAISGPRLPSGQTVLRRFQATSRPHFGWVDKPLSRLTPSGFAHGTPLLCSPPSRGDALVLQRLARPLSTGTDGGSCIHEVLRSAKHSVRSCCVPKVGKSTPVNQLAIKQTLPTLRLEQTSPDARWANCLKIRPTTKRRTFTNA
jgi:hypothetical protein